MQNRRRATVERVCICIIFRMEILDEILDYYSALPPAAITAALVVILITLIYIISRKGVPPGPTGLPYLGIWPFMNNENMHLKLHKMKEKYGDVFSFTSTGRLYINLGSIKALKEAHITKSECFGERLEDFSMLGYFFRDAVVFVRGEAWKAIRKFFLQVLKERGSVSIKNTMSDSLYESLKSTVKDLKSRNGEPLNLIELLTDKCNAVMRLSLFGDVGISEEQIREINILFADEIACMTPMNVLLAGKFAKYIIFPLKPEYRKARSSHRKAEKILLDIVNEHKATYDEGHARDIIDDYIKERNKRRSKGDPTAEYFTDVSLTNSLIQFMGDGVLSLAAFISVIIRVLIDYPEEQEKVYKEIVEVVGLERQPSMDDKSKLTYLNAVILEGNRVSDMFPVFPSLECTKETTLNGYKIPKGAVTLMNFYSAHKDPDVFEDPLKFNPSRYIQTDGKRRPELPVTFGIGKRACLGEGYVMMQLFLFLATIIQNFRLTLPEGVTTSTHELFMTGKLQVCAHPRDQK
ncbi:cytochrome P450 2B11 [Trichonephila inaurata madagascariensis]|uniref:Cytochrome P450 2B11 n=1 Tax=Trichonephila inaurata madagascariensis TaxID=2747483 RepID=A0A8X6WUS5_9ARAC|nr:cytochrome P450 2B11 [Trichonephila inaurata madagascariensis]